MSAYGSTIKEGRTNAIVNKIRNTFADSPSYFEVSINNSSTTTGVQIVDDSSSINQTNQNDKIIIMQPGDNLSVGDMIKHNNKNWLCVASELFNDIYYKGKITKCNQILNMHVNSLPYEIPIIIESGVRLFQLGTDSNKYLETPSTTVVARLPNTAITRQIIRSEKYQIGIQNYVVNDINDIIESGLLILKLEYSAEAQETHVYSLNILNGDNLSLTLGETLQLDVQIFDGTTIVSPTPSITYTVSNTLVATVSATGLITSLIEGDVIISAKLSSNLTVLDTLNLTIQEVVADNYTVDVYGDSSIVLSDTKTINAKVYNNGVEDITKGVNWTVINEDGTVLEYLSIDSQDSNSITLTATSNSAYKNKNVVIKGTFTEDILVFDEHIIKIMSLF